MFRTQFFNFFVPTTFVVKLIVTSEKHSKFRERKKSNLWEFLIFIIYLPEFTWKAQKMFICFRKSTDIKTLENILRNSSNFYFDIFQYYFNSK